MIEVLRAPHVAAVVTVFTAAATVFLPGGSTAIAQTDDPFDMTSRVVYEIRPDQGVRRVSWEVTVVNNDPSTSSGGSGGSIFFYEGISLPVMADAQNLTARSSGDKHDGSTLRSS